MNEYVVITWADRVPAEDVLADAARDRDGQLLAAGPVHDASELDSRSAPAGLVIARFSTEEAARSWFDAVLGKLDGGPAPHAMALMAWPNEQTRHAWYHGSLYRPYRDQRHRASRTSNVSVRALSPHP